MKYKSVYIITVSFICLIQAQLLDNYNGISGLMYSSEGIWQVSNGVFESQTGSISSPEHSYASYDLTNSHSNWSLDKSKENEWIGWMDLNRTSVSGWGGSNYSCGLVLAANSYDFNETTTSGYAIGFKNDTSDDLVLFKFSEGIISGTTTLPGTSTEILNSGYTYSNTDNGVNFYVKQNPNGTWTVKYKSGIQLSEVNAVNPENYSDGTVTSISADETYTGTSYKYSGWIYAHNSSSSEKAYFDNYGIGSTDQSLPVELSSFTADNSIPGVIILSWTTESEIQNLGFIIERRSYGTDWAEIASYITDDKLRGQGSVTYRTDYSFRDRMLESNKMYDYRLADVSYNGEVAYHDQMICGIELNSPEQIIETMSSYPNPFNSLTIIQYQVLDKSKVTIDIYDLGGRKIKTLIDKEIHRGSYEVIWNSNNLSSGIYLAVLNQNKKRKTLKIVLMK